MQGKAFGFFINARKKIIHIILTADEETIKFRIRNDDSSVHYDFGKSIRKSKTIV